MQDILRPEDMPVTEESHEERRYAQEATLQRLVTTTDHIHKELGNLALSMTERVTRNEQETKNQGTILAGLSIVVGRHTEAISWIKGSGTTAVVMLGIFEVVLGCVLAWFLSHVGIKP